MHTLVPYLQGTGIVLAVEVPDLGLQAGPFYASLPDRGRRQHAPREDVALDEVHGVAVALESRVGDGDDLEGSAAAGLEAILDGLEVGIPVTLPHRLEHLDGHDAIVLALHVPVIHQ